jgi:hypothetical protein
MGVRAAFIAVAVTGVVAALASAAPGAAAAPAPGRVVQANLSRLSCRGSSFCMAVGSYSTAKHQHVRLIEYWNGKTWRIAPDSFGHNFFNLTCGSPTFCLAAQNETGDLAVWRGRTWRPFGNRPSNVTQITCGSPTACWTLNGAFLARWTGKAWVNDPDADACSGTPECGWNSVTCGSGQSCLAFGQSCDTTDCEDGPSDFAEGWNGKVWNGYGIEFSQGTYVCTGDAFCMATSGPYDAAAGTGGNWQNVSPDLAAICHNQVTCNLSGLLACGSATMCVSVPPNSQLTLMWNGTTWRTAWLALAGGQLPDLTTLSCGSATSCMATGTYGSGPLSVAEHWNGKRWQLSDTLNS